MSNGSERMRPGEPEALTRRQWLVWQTILGGAGVMDAVEAVSSVAMAHPDWNMEETKTMAEWEGTTT